MLATRGRAGRKLLAVAAFCAFVACAGPRAYAAWSFELGIGEQQSAMFSDPRFDALGLEHVRLVVPHDVACSPGAAWQYFDAWLAAAERAGARPLVAFSSSLQRGRRKLPSYRAFLRCFRAFRARWPRVVDFNPWNEANHWYQPTHRHPRRAAGLYNAARRACPGSLDAGPARPLAPHHAGLRLQVAGSVLPRHLGLRWFRSDGSSRPSYRVLVAELARERNLDRQAAAALNPRSGLVCTTAARRAD